MCSSTKCRWTLRTFPLNKFHRRNNFRARNRSGATLIELALVLPVFFMFVFALFEFGHALMVANTLTSIAKQAAHHGSFEGVSTAQVQSYATERLNNILPSGSAVTYIKDASTFESTSTDPGTVNVSSLPDIELNSAESRQLFIVRIEVPYDAVALLSPFWIHNATLTGVSIMRRE